MKILLIKDLMMELNSKHYSSVETQKRPEYLEWAGSNIADMANEFVQKNKLLDSYFIKGMNRIFRTSRFELLLKRWIVAYLWDFFSMLDDFLSYHSQLNEELVLEDMPLSRFGIMKYYSRFGLMSKIKWKKQANLLQKIFSISLKSLSIFYLSLSKGLRIYGKRKQYKVMREAIWGLYDTGGNYLHDDFFIDDNKIKKEEFLLFSRGIPKEKGRLKGYHDAKKSPYAHFDLSSLPLGINSFLSRIIPKYIISASIALFKEMYSSNFSLYWSVYLSFIYSAMPYEKVFSNYEVVSELGHNYFSAGHIAEAIICENYGTKYYLMHLSDHAVSINKFLFSYLGCDGLLLWGKAHAEDAIIDDKILKPMGYVFKKFIKEAIINRDKVINEIGIKVKGKVITFFDESFGGRCKMTGDNYVTFWDTALRLAQQTERDNVILIKPKDLSRADNLSRNLLEKFIDIKNKLEKMENVRIITSDKWSFMEVIGISDIVVTQGMTSSATIAIICGIQGMYLDQAQYDHPFSKAFKDAIVFDNPEKILLMIQKILIGKENPLKNIPEGTLRAFDEYQDERGIDLFRDILSGKTRRRVGVIIQARMGSTRLPGKAMRPILNKPILEILVERLRRCKKTDLLSIATTINKNDDIIEALARKLKVECFRGDEEDVLGRYYEAAKKYGLDIIVRITSDCPLTDPSLVDDVIVYYLDNPQVDYVSNVINRTYPRGFDIEVFSFQSLKKASEKAVKPYQREHVTPFIYENMGCLNYEDDRDSSKYRVTVDTVEDFELVSAIYDILNKGAQFGYRQVVDLLDSRPDLVALNQFVEQKAVK
ncbi:MAG: glycosyltransferase family protein [Candidatus Gorgyraea atricola]|nr:glycosyltransferase family protein [Candidatus Gorgyraea atricola]